MSVRNLDRMFKPRSIALIGATSPAAAPGALVLRNLRRAGFPGTMLRVGPRHEPIDGLPVCPDIASLPTPPDLAVIVDATESAASLIAALGRRGTRAALIMTTGVAEQAVLDAARPFLLRLLGPDSLGIIVPGQRLDASAAPLAPRAGELALVSQSGAMITAVLDWAVPRRIGFSHVVSLGDMADIDVGDMLDYLAGDEAARAILLYVERLKEARKFMSAARAAARTKPVLVVKAGRFEQGAGAPPSKTSALAPPDAVYDTAFRRAGMLRVGDMTELFEAVETLALTEAQRGDRLAILTNGHGPGLLAMDELIARGGMPAALSPTTRARLDAALPKSRSRANPIDLLGDADGKRYADVLAILLEDDGVDGILALNSPTASAEPRAVAEAVIAAINGARQKGLLQGRNVLTAWLGEHSAAPARHAFDEARIPTYETPNGAVRGFLHRVKYQRHQELLLETPAAGPDGFEPDRSGARTIITRALAAGRAWLDAEEVAALLAAYGIPFQRTARRPQAIELMIGLADDALFGPILVFGQGGAAAEPHQDVSLELPPLNDALARAQMARSRVWRRLQGYRGQPPADIAALSTVLIRLGQLAADQAELVELHINPLLADAAGIIGSDGRIRVAPTAERGPARLSISPYPRELITSAALPDGTSLRLRPVRPEDEPLLIDLARHMNLEDLRMRFFTSMKSVPHHLAARLSQIDYDREMALIAEADAAVLGVARFSADPDNQRAEFAIAIRSDWKRRGLGRLLMRHLIEVARRRGIGALFGDVLRENDAMLALCRALGFSVGAHPSDLLALRVTLPLRP